MTVPVLPLTVLGGYLGAGKTTVVNHLLTVGPGRRLGVIVNDFGALPVDAELLTAAAGEDGVINLPNGCVCCTLGGGLAAALARLAELDPRPEHVLVEASGVADPAAVAAWGTTPPFEPGGVIVVAAATDVRRLADDRYVGREVRGQLVAADLVLVTHADAVAADTLAGVESWLDGVSKGAPQLRVDHGVVDPDVVLGVRPERPAEGHGAHHDAHYRSWEWESTRPLAPGRIEAFLDALPPTVLRLKGWVSIEATPGVVRVQVVGRRRELQEDPRAAGHGTSRLVAVGPAAVFDPDQLDRLAP